ncbi:protein DOG1-like 4 [Punica granatum]|uniref:DOG1 domain-containing protein n=2 Tax=Punica granatum TaxID=22663 RepID=A0A218WF97_PUNGR|nr:protein DOG1-like 4 [Punica granatum]OWM70742.1 hypothetical protein CDL15_Pgr014415 [Punica granatum]PKI64848.1 hypothetical protein CRG98_014763 [Punica granatum]
MAQPIHSAAAHFTTFFGHWLDHHQALLDQLLPLAASNGLTTDHNSHQLASAIGQVLLHYQHYFDEASKLAREDIFLLLSAPWLSPLERTFLWNGGFKPTLVFSLIDGRDLTAEQVRDIEQLRAEAKRKERELGEAMAGVQESVAAPPLQGLLRLRARGARALDGEEPDLEMAVEGLRAAMRGVLEGADALRGATVRGLMEVLRPDQTVRFLVAAAEFQLRVRRWGLEGNSKISKWR